MTPADFIAAADKLVPLKKCESDREQHAKVAALLKSDPSAVYRWAHGKRGIPGPVEVALHALVTQRAAERRVARLERDLRRASR